MLFLCHTDGTKPQLPKIGLTVISSCALNSVMKNRRQRSPGVIAAVDAAGSMTGLGKLLGITAQAVAGWSVVPTKRVSEIERVTGVKRSLLRPDIYPEEREVKTKRIRKTIDMDVRNMTMQELRAHLQKLVDAGESSSEEMGKLFSKHCSSCKDYGISRQSSSSDAR
jgi:DNA-binding transcriptional regulator YdaS (Cro superfamily)